MSAWPASMAAISVPGLTGTIVASSPSFMPLLSIRRLVTLKLVLGSGEVAIFMPLNFLGSVKGSTVFETAK